MHSEFFVPSSYDQIDCKVFSPDQSHMLAQYLGSPFANELGNNGLLFHDGSSEPDITLSELFDGVFNNHSNASCEVSQQLPLLPEKYSDSAGLGSSSTSNNEVKKVEESTVSQTLNERSNAGEGEGPRINIGTRQRQPQASMLDHYPMGQGIAPRRIRLTLDHEEGETVVCSSDEEVQSAVSKARRIIFLSFFCC